MDTVFEAGEGPVESPSFEAEQPFEMPAPNNLSGAQIPLEGANTPSVHGKLQPPFVRRQRRRRRASLVFSIEVFQPESQIARDALKQLRFFWTKETALARIHGK